jgi:hypothetical protein
MLVVVWLNMALQPCAMAFGNEQDCPQCPPAHSREMPSQDSHDRALEDAPCYVGASQCAFSDDYNYDGRSVQIKVKDAPSDVPVAIAPAVVGLSLADTVSASLGPDDPSHRPGVPRSLNILYCVYLD